jgi:hypothetical protein
MGRDRAPGDVIGLGAGQPQFGVVAAMEMPVAFQLWASGAAGKFFIYVGPLHIPMLLHVIVRDLIRDALVAQSFDQPIENWRGVALSYRCADAISIKVGANLVDQARGTGETANAVDHPDRVIGCGRLVLGMFSAVDLTMLTSRRGAHSGQIIETNLR